MNRDSLGVSGAAAGPKERTQECPRLSLWLATGFGLGYMPFASGTWGSLGSLPLYLLIEWSIPRLGGLLSDESAWAPGSWRFLGAQFALNVVLALLGVRVAGRAARYFGENDPSRVVIDEISGQQIAFLGLAPLGWKHMAAGFLLFRIFDIWKPFPARQAQSWPAGWGIMADDWFAGLYVALLIWVARYLHW